MTPRTAVRTWVGVGAITIRVAITGQFCEVAVVHGNLVGRSVQGDVDST